MLYTSIVNKQEELCMSELPFGKSRPKPFRVFVTNQYYANRDEYDAIGQQQPWSFGEYYKRNLAMLKQQYKQTVRGK